MGIATISGGKRIAANGVLAELTRLKQFACSLGKLRSGEFYPETPSCKLDWILEFLEEREDLDGKVVIASQYTKVCEWLVREIRAKHWDTVTITGKSTDKQREHAQKVFMANPNVRVAVINMYAGGEAIDLSAADEMIIVDEPWETTVIQQVENRIQNLAKSQQLTIYRLRAEGTVEEDIAGMTDAQREALMRGEPKALEHLIELRDERLGEAA